MAVKKKSFARLLMMALVALSLAVSAYAHRPMVQDGAAAASVDYEAYRLPDGSLPSFCINGQTQSPGHQHGAQDCDFCTLAHGSMVPQILAAPVAIRDGSDQAATQLPTVFVSTPCLPGHPSTGPPYFS